MADAQPRSVLWRRLGAFGIDIALLFAVLAPVGGLVQWALGVSPETGREIYAALVVNFSLPTWAYFVASDASRRGQTLGKRWLGLRTMPIDGGRLGLGRALGRTALKLLPWELTHASFFLLPPSPAEMTPLSGASVVVAYALGVLYLVIAWRTAGRRSAHDLAAATRVTRSGGADSGERLARRALPSGEP